MLPKNTVYKGNKVEIEKYIKNQTNKFQPKEKKKQGRKESYKIAWQKF